MGMFVEHHGDSKTGICSEFVFFCFFLVLFFLVTLPVELFFGDYVFDCFFLNIFLAKINFLCSTRDHKNIVSG
jgi:hypothetical protein